MNWGHYITITFIAFAVMILSFAYRASQQNIDLVYDDYYERELKYDETMGKMKNTRDHKKELHYTLSASEIKVQCDSCLDMKGTIHFFWPNDSKYDVSFEMDQNHLNVSKATFKKQGKFKAVAEWTCNGIEYYDEQAIMVY